MITLVLAFKLTLYIAKLQGFLSLGFIHIKIQFKVESKQKLVLSAAELRKEWQKKEFVADETKRSTLMPANQKIKTKKEIEEKAPKPLQPQKKKTPPLEKSFIHKFYGSRLIIGDMRIGGGLSKGIHQLEITKDQLLIDNVPQSINQGELEKIKELIRTSRGE